MTAVDTSALDRLLADRVVLALCISTGCLLPVDLSTYPEMFNRFLNLSCFLHLHYKAT